MAGRWMTGGRARPGCSRAVALAVTLAVGLAVALVPGSPASALEAWEIGDRIWLDDSSDPAQWGPGGSRNNGLLEATDDGNLSVAGLQDPGIVGVDVELVYDANGDGIVNEGDWVVQTTTTTAGGAYLFSGVFPDDYIVRIPPSEFATGQPLNGLVSSFDATAQADPTDQVDEDDNGVDVVDATATGVASRRVVTGPFDPDGDPSIDFGFTRPPMSIGNRVFLDDHPTDQASRGNGVQNAQEPGIDGVETALYRDLDLDGVVDAGEDTGLRDTTEVNGFYAYSNLPGGSYIVAVTDANFLTGGPLENTISSRSVAPNPVASDNGVDGNDNGRDPFVAGIGIISPRIALSYGNEPSGESPTGPDDGPGGAGTHGERNVDSDLTVDFGFYVPMSLGNRVWLDDTDVPANASTRDDGVLDPATDDLDNPNQAGVQGLGVAGVTMRLYADRDTDGVIDAGEDTGRTTTTNATGYYLFDALPRGSYIVGVEASSFASGGRLAGFRSSTDATPRIDDDIDSRDKGVGTTPSPTVGVQSPSILLSWTSQTVGNEPLAAAEPDPTPQVQANRGVNGERDDFSNSTTDFGFVRANRAPIATADSYGPLVYGTTFFSTGAPGVLRNDSDPDGNTLTASLVTGVAHGALTFYTDGSFSYEPNAGFSGTDSFTYRASDGSLSSSPVTASITVSAKPGPTADAGPDQRVTEGHTVTLDGAGSSASDGGPLSYSWVQTAGPAVTLDGADTANPTFTAPASPDPLTFELTVTDLDGKTGTDTVTVTRNSPPTADAGPDQEATALTFALDGTGSTDPEGDQLSYSWVQIGGPEAFIVNDTTATPTVLAFNGPADYAFQLTVTDFFGGTDTDEVVVGFNDAPTADAGADQVADAGDTVTLDGTGSSDPEDDPLGYGWVQTAGPAVTLSGATTPNPTFTAPDAYPATMTFELTVADDQGLSSTDTVSVRMNGRPEADAGPDQQVLGGDTVTLTGAGSSDPDGDTLRYQWDQTYGPAVVLSSRSAVAPAFTAPAGPTELRFRLIVRDPSARFRTDFVTIVVEAPLVASAGPDQTVNPSALVTLSGSADGAGLRYQWDQTSGPAVTLSGAKTATPSFTAPATPVTLRFRLIVRDKRGQADTDTVTITVAGDPVADAGPNRVVTSGEVVTLDGTGSSPGARYQWTQTYGATVALSGSTTRTPSFTAPVVTGPRDLRFRLIVRDSAGRFTTDFVHVTVQPPA